MYEEQPEKMGDAINRHLTKRQTGGYRDLAREFVTRLDQIAPEATLRDDSMDMIKYPPINEEIKIGKLTIKYGRRSGLIRFIDAKGMERVIDDAEGNVMRMIEAATEGSGAPVKSVIRESDGTGVPERLLPRPEYRQPGDPIQRPE